MSGGAVNFDKCNHIIMQWSLNKHGIKYMKDPDFPDLTFHDEHNTQHKIERLSIRDKQKYVGITTSPSGNQNHPIYSLVKIS